MNTQSPCKQPATDAPTLTEQRLEIAVFLFLIVPSMAYSFLAVRQGNVGFGLVALSTILRDLALLSLIAFFLWRNRESPLQIGWTRRRLPREVGWGLLLFGPMTLGASLLERALLRLGFTSPRTPLPGSLEAQTPYQLVLALVLVVIIAVAEETIFRGYLLLRFKAFVRSPLLGALASAAVFSIGHGYEGSAGVLTVGSMGFVFALVYLWRKSLAAPITMHFLQDFTAIVLAPVVGHL
jgi:membrane protease YdiL (CAAX protease family)